MKMYNLLPTEKVLILIPVYSSEKNRFNELVVEEYIEHEVPGCLVIQNSTNDLTIEGMEMLDRSLITVHIPKNFNESLKEAIIVVRGIEYFVHGNPMKINTPPLGITWDRPVICEERVL